MTVPFPLHLDHRQRESNPRGRRSRRGHPRQTAALRQDL